MYLRSKFGGIHWFGISITLAILVLLLLASTYIIHKWRERQRELANSLYQEDAQINCFGLPKKVQGIQPAKGHIVTVVIISSKMEKLKGMTGVKVIEIDWPGNENGLRDLGISNEVAREIVMVFKRIISKEWLQETWLRIVHIKVRRPSNELPVLPLLRYIADNSKSVDVLVVPNFSLNNGLTSEGAKRALELLKKIKEDTVVVCASKRYNDIPSREVIAVGVVKGDQTVSEVYSGTDFVVDLAGEKDLEASFKEGPATVAGIAAAIICILKLHTNRVSRVKKLPNLSRSKDTSTNKKYMKETAVSKDVHDVKASDTIELESIDNTSERLISDKDKAKEIENHIKTTAGMRQLLLQLLQKELTQNQPALGGSNPYWGFGKLVLAELNLQDSVVVEQAFKSERPTARVNKYVKECVETEDLEKDKREAINQLKREVFKVSNSATQQENTTKIKSTDVSSNSGHDQFWIKIAVLGRGIGNGTTGYVKLSSIQQDICRNTADQLGVDVMSHVLSSGLSDSNYENLQSLSELVGFRFFSVLDEGMNAKWDDFGKLLEELCKENVDVVHIYGTASQPVEGYQVGKNLKKLKQKSVVITCSSDNTLPANFPSESVIAVRSYRGSDVPSGLKQRSRSPLNNGSQDQTEDSNAPLLGDKDNIAHSFIHLEVEQARKEKRVWKFLSKHAQPKGQPQNQTKDVKTKLRSKKEEKKVKGVSGGPLDFLAYEPQGGRHMGSYYATAVVGLIMLRAIALGISGDQAKLLRNTAVMHSILRAISFHPEKHTHTEGWGVIYPWLLLKDDKEFHKVIDKYTGPDRLTYFWDGKNM